MAFGLGFGLNLIRAGLTAGGVSVPQAPTIDAVLPGNAQAQVSFSPPADDGGSAITGYTVTSSPGGITATGAASPITVSGLTNGTAYTFTVHATNDVGDSAESAASDSIVTGPVNLIWEGDSITATGGSTTNLLSYANQYSGAANKSVSSSTITGSAPSLENRASTVDGLMQVGAHNVLVVMTGNDMITGTASDETTRLASYLDDRAAAAVTGGYILTRIVLSTLPRTTSGFNAKRNTANATKATWVGSHCEIFVNLDNCGIGQDADASNASYYADGVHPTDAGNALILAAVKPVIDALMPSLSGAPQTDLIEHWKLGYDLTQSGGKASSWKGRRQAFNLAQSTGTKQPAVQGDSSLLFDGTDDLLAALFAFEAAGATVCLLMKQPTWTNAKCIANLAVPPHANSLWKFGTTPDFITHTAVNNGTQTAGLTLDTYGTVIFGISAASSILQVNAGTTTNDTGFTISGSKGSLILGALSDGLFHANVQIKEVLIYRGILDATARAAVRDYFATVA